MKTCPVCGASYSARISFCFEDGSVLVAAAADEASSPSQQAAAGALLERLMDALGLSPIAERGELLRLGPEELEEFDVRGLSHEPSGDPSLYCVVRPGWSLGPLVLDRPLLEPVGEPSRARTDRFGGEGA